MEGFEGLGGNTEGLAWHSLELANRGGVVIWVLLAFSLFGLAIVLLKFYQFARLRIWRRAWIHEAVRAVRDRQPETALEIARRNPGTFSRVIAIAIEEHQREDLSDDALREEVQRAGDAELGSLESYLRGLDVIGSLAPLLGLLGTVLGMIRAFMRLEEAGPRVDPSLLSGGIWEALLTTAIGLAVAIPANVALAWLESQVDSVRRTLADAVTRVLTAPRSVAAAPPPLAVDAPLRPTGRPRAL
jgi:biopolymer transport protein ExbB